MPSSYFADAFATGPDAQAVQAAGRDLRKLVREVLDPESAEPLRRLPGTRGPATHSLSGQHLAYESRALPQRVPEFSRGLRAISQAHPGVRLVVAAVDANDPQDVGVSIAQSGAVSRLSLSACHKIMLEHARFTWGQRGADAFFGQSSAGAGWLDPAELGASFLQQIWREPPMCLLDRQPFDGPPPRPSLREPGGFLDPAKPPARSPRR